MKGTERFGADRKQLEEDGIAGAAKLWRDEFESLGYRAYKKPKWFRRILDKEYDGGWEFGHHAWYDHPAKLGDDSLLVQPYHFSEDDARDLMAFCEKHRLTFSVHPQSAHYPGRTLAIVIRPRTENSDYHSQCGVRYAAADQGRAGTGVTHE